MKQILIFCVVSMFFLGDTAFAKKFSIDRALKRLLTRSDQLHSKYEQIHSQHYAQYPGFFVFLEPQYDTYRNESNRLRETVRLWNANKTIPFESYIDLLPGIIFDSEEGEAPEDRSKSLVKIVGSRLGEQEKIIETELKRINMLVNLAPNAANHSLPSLHNESVHLFTRLRHAIFKLNYTDAEALLADKSTTVDDMVDTVFRHVATSKQLTAMVHMEMLLGGFTLALKEELKLEGGLDLASLQRDNQLYQYYKLVVERQIRQANKAFKEMIQEDPVKKRLFEEHLKEQELIYQRMKI